ncbi:MAG: hypothetical protein IKC24_08915 [Oscillospiraceae bacterium]|nr:hypothetical protein [Oscillospiraceae bacterium]
MNTYKVDFVANTITITAAFAKAMNDPTSAEYKIIAQIRKDFPEMEIIRKTHKTPTKYQTKTGEKFNCNQFKNLTYDNMKTFIEGLPNNKDIKAAYNFLRYCGNLPQTSRYTAVRKWFVVQFPEFRKNPLFYLYNEVKVIDITTFIEEEKQRAAELAEKKAREEAEKTA